VKAFRTSSCTRSTIALAALAATCALTSVAAPSSIAAQPTAVQDPGAVTATLEQCVTSPVQDERSATFAGEMTSIPGAVRLTMRIDLEERAPREAEFHPVTAQGLGVWRTADPKVRVYKYLRQVTNLASPDSYRGRVRFRWINAKGHAIKRAERLTGRCVQPASPIEPAPAGPSAPPASSTTGAGQPMAGAALPSG
jgi:hypothetical protein